MTSSYDLPLLPVGTAVKISAEGAWGQGTEGTIERAYRIRFGHRMYDVRSRFGHLHTYYAHSQLTVLQDAGK